MYENRFFDIACNRSWCSYLLIDIWTHAGNAIYLVGANRLLFFTHFLRLLFSYCVHARRCVHVILHVLTHGVTPYRIAWGDGFAHRFLAPAVVMLNNAVAMYKKSIQGRTIQNTLNSVKGVHTIDYECQIRGSFFFKRCCAVLRGTRTQQGK